MGFATFNQISVHDLVAMADGVLEDTITDMDFLETLAGRHCVVVPPWVLRVSPAGGLSKVTRLVYTTDGALDKPRILLAAARELRRERALGRFWGRFSI
jgi:hypothetical protein